MKESKKRKINTNSNKPSSLDRFYPNSSVPQMKIRIRKSKLLFFYLTKSSQPTKPIRKKVNRTNKTGNLFLSSMKRSTTHVIKKSANANNLSSIAGRLYVASSNAKVQCNQFTIIHSKYHIISTRNHRI